MRTWRLFPLALRYQTTCAIGLKLNHHWTFALPVLENEAIDNRRPLVLLRLRSLLEHHDEIGVVFEVARAAKMAQHRMVIFVASPVQRRRHTDKRRIARNYNATTQLP